jgi:tRNA(Ile)-lysidine synthase
MASTRPLSAAALFPFVVSQLRANVRPHSRVCVGLSGGRDSVVLLHLICNAREELAIDVSAIHVNHQISPNASRWAEFCVALCAKFDVPLRVDRVTVARGTGKGLEASARDARYAAYTSVAADLIVLGHHRADQAETVLLQALRGAGLAGIRGMPVAKRFGENKQILRPLLDVVPEILADYANSHNLNWINDESNDDTRYTRNYIRHEILPLLAKHIPQSGESLVRLSQHAAEAQTLLDDLGEIDCANVFVGERISISRLVSLPVPRAKNLLRHWLTKAGIPLPNAVQLDEIVVQLAARQPDSQTEINWSNWRLRCFQDEIYLARKPLDIAAKWSIDWRSESKVTLPNACGTLRVEKALGAGIAENRLTGKNLTIRSRVGGEKFRISRVRPRRALKNLLQEAKIPPWYRDAMPLLFCDETLIWVPGIGIDISFVAKETEPGLLFSWQEGAT